MVAVVLLRPPLARAAELTWTVGAGFRAAELPVPSEGHTGFTLQNPSATGVIFTNSLADERYLTNQIYLNGSGVAAGDIDGDGRVDLYFCSLAGANKLYRNLGGWKFEDITESAGVGCSNLVCSGAAFADVDGDGHLDLIVNTVGGGTHIFLNDGKGHFTPAAEVLNQDRAGMSLALADIDGDGRLDLYIANYRTSTIRDHPNTKLHVNYDANGKLVLQSVDGRPVTEPDLIGRYHLEANGRVIENGEPDALYRNDGGGRFTLLSFTDGTFLDEDGHPLATPPFDWGLSVMFRDLNGDGAPDLYVCNDFLSEDRVWLNDGKGRFRALPRLALRSTSMFSMGIDFADLNRDGYDEFFVADMLSRDHRKRHVQVGGLSPTILPVGKIDDRPQYSRNTLFYNRGDGTYAEIGQFSGVDASEWSWAPVFLDVDLDGYEDLLMTTGHERDMRNADVINRGEELKAQKKMSITEVLKLRAMFARLALPIVAFRNRGDLTFADSGAAWGFNTPGVSHGMALADLDNDGDLDLVINYLNGPAALYRNETAAPRIAVRLKGTPPNTRGIGAKIKVLGGAVPMQSQEMIAGGRYLSSDDPMRVFAAGTLTNHLRIEVVWRSGKRSLVDGALANHVYEIDEAQAQNSPVADAVGNDAPRKPFFEDVSELINHSHHEEPFDDFAFQHLLPRKLSQLGPGVSWFDVDGDGWDDLIVGSGKGGQLAVFRNDGHGGFKPMPDEALAQPVTRDQTTILGWNKGVGQTVLLAGSANYEQGLADGAAVLQYDLVGKRVDATLPAQEASAGPLAMADIEGKGRLSLFVGGRVTSGRYPEAASSMLLRDLGGKWELDADNTAKLAKVGLVSGAVWSDLDGDGLPELILACEWGPIRVFQNKGGSLTEITDALGLANSRGWWNGVTTADLDGDGKLDIIATGWGWNNVYQRRGVENLRLYYGDFPGNGGLETIEAYFDPAMNKVVPFRNLSSVAKALPWLRARFASFQQYAAASVGVILGERLNDAQELKVDTLASTVFLNRGGRFEARALPAEAQWSPAFGVSAGDFDGDGAEDLFLSQNFFAVQPETARLDAGRGLWLRGDGHGGFTPVPGQVSGVKVYGEQRGCALADYDGDGRIDLVVTQNGAQTKLYRNVGAKPGLRVRVAGPVGNPNGIGATLRLKFADKLGPAREIHAGSGYWSQDSAVQVMATPETPTQIWVRWPGGKTQTLEVPPGAREVQVSLDGGIKALR